MSDIGVGATTTRPAVCEDCGLNYPVGRLDIPITGYPYTCDDCGGYVEVVDSQETSNADV